VLRSGSGSVVVRPRRTRCVGCGVSHVLLPVFALVRRADLAEVIGAALAAKASGAGARAIAAGIGRPVETVRGWLRRFAGRAEEVRTVFTVLLVDTALDPVPPAAMTTPFADAVAAVFGASVAAASRWPHVGEVSCSDPPARIVRAWPAVKDRLDITGARWGLTGAEAVLKLRALRSNGDFDSYWAWHEKQEFNRNHQARYRDALIPAA
jgi:hypothetical protein